MGFFSNLIKHAAATGKVLAGDYLGYDVTFRTLDNTKCMGMISGKNDIIVKKSDVKEFSIIETNAKFKFGSDIKIGNRYKVVLNDGKSFILGVIATYCSQYEAIFMI